MLRIVVSPEYMAHAEFCAERRPQHIRNHVPPTDPLADLAGCVAEYAWVQHYRFPPDTISWNGGNDGRGDAGWDFVMREGTVDIKASRKYPHSWVVKKHRGEKDLRADWYVFAYVMLPDTVQFRYKAPRSVIEGLPAEDRVGGHRLVRYDLPGVTEFGDGDFHRK